MLARMRHPAVLVLGFALLTLVVACGGTQPLPDIEATVQARLNEERAAEGTVEARAQVLAKAMVEATAQAMPRATLTAFVSNTTMALVEDGEVLGSRRPDNGNSG